MTQGPLLDVRTVTVDYGGVRALAGASLQVAPGEIVGLIGPNGSGKTTLLDVISGQVTPAAGGVHLDGIDLVDHLPEDRAALGLVRSFQDCRLFPELTVEETLMVAEDARSPVGVLAAVVGGPASRRRESEKRAQVERLLAALGLERFRHATVEELSTGTRRIVDLATIVAAGPRLLLLDEPTAGIAQREAEAFGPLLRRLHAVTGAAICMVEHDVPLVMALCHRVLVMEAGEVVAGGTPEEVAADPAAVAAYLGASREAIARSGLVETPTAGRPAPADGRRTGTRQRPLRAARNGRNDARQRPA